MAITGLRHTENFATNERPENWREGILLQYPNGDTPLLALTSQMRTEHTDDPKYHWWEKQLDNRELTISADLSSDGTTLTMTSGAKSVVKNTLLKNLTTGEIVKVTANPTADTALTVERGYADTTATAITVASGDPKFLVIGTAFEEGSDAPKGQGYDPSERWNYTQIFRRTLEITRTAAATRLRTKPAVQEAKRECLEYIGIDMERAFWFSKASLTYVDSKPCRTMDGVYEQIANNAASNIFDFGSTGADYEDLEDMMKQIFKYGSKEKICFCGDTLLLTIQRILRTVKNLVWNIDAGAKEYGMDVVKLKSPFGTIVFKTCPLFNNSANLNSWGFVLDMDKVSYVVFDKDDLRYQPKLQDNGLDGEKSGYLAECSIKVAQAENHAVIKNLKAVKAGSGEETVAVSSISGKVNIGTVDKITEVTELKTVTGVVKTQEQQA